MLSIFCKVTQQDGGRNRKPDPRAVIFLVWPLKQATLMRSRVAGESHVSASNESHHFLSFTGINPGGVKTCTEVALLQRGQLLLKNSNVLGH